ncbi:MAG: LacI family DNA-binding transcriptional regulator [Lentisphaeria bacterium]|jgi:DNA-binding LacI/PurR family transcriptional regulator
MPAVTLKDVAREAGVALTTAAVALRRDFRIALKPATRRRILAVARRLGYRRNQQAAALRTGRSDWVGVLAGSLGMPVGLLKLREIERGLREHGFRCLVRETGGDPELEARFLQEFTDSRVAGLVVSDWPSPALAARLAPLTAHGLPVLALEPFAEGQAGIACVTVDRFSGGEQAGRHLAALGHRRIARLAGRVGDANAQRRFAGLDAALAAAGIPPLLELEEPVAEHSFAGGYAAATRLLARRRDFTALSCVNDEVAIGAMRALREAGLRIPRDLSVVGFDDIPVAPYAPVPLTTVAQPVGEVAAEAIRWLLPRLQRRAAAPAAAVAVIRMPMRLVVRESSAPPPALAVPG